MLLDTLRKLLYTGWYIQHWELCKIRRKICPERGKSDMPPKHQTFTTRQKMQKPSFEIFHYKDEYMKEVALHHHDFYEVYFFVSGNVTYNIESRSYRLTPGDILLISPMELHQPMFSGERNSYERYVLWINSNFLQQFSMPGQEMTRCFDTTQPNHTNLLRPDGTKRELLAFLLSQLLMESQSQEYGSELGSMSLLAQIMVVLNRLAMLAERQTDLKSGSDSVVYRVLEYINENYYDDLNLDMLANKFFISKYHLSREFNRLVGTSVYRYIIQKRLVMAKQLMSAGVPSTTVYQHCGFGDYSNFYRAFKSEYQMSPKEFVTSLRESSFDQEEFRIHYGEK